MDFFGSLNGADWTAIAATFFEVMMIDLVLAGDNAVAVGLAAAGLPTDQRKKVILWGLAAAVIMRIGFALITVQLLAIIGLLLAGGILLLWVCWKMWRELHQQHRDDHARGELALEEATGIDVNCGDPTSLPEARRKTFKQAFLQILIADLSMSLDNVLAVAGAAREHPAILIFGLLLSIALMGLAASWIAKLLHKYTWIGYLGLVIVLYVALHMIWEGHRQLVVDLGRTAQYNAAAPAFIDIGPEEEAEILAH
jgi:YjbE family integral membrane protein